MLPYMICFIPILLIIRYLKYIKLKKINYYHEVLLFIFYIFLIGLISQTIITNNIGYININKINIIPFKFIIDMYNKDINYFIINFLGNIIMFIPIGLCIPLLWNISNKKVLLIGFSLSMFIELCQLFLNRNTDIDDVILNTIGVFIGIIIYNLLNKKYNLKINKFKERKSI